MNDIKFWHKVKLKDGTYTNGKKDIEASLDNHLFNALDFKGKSVLDVGCWDGAFSFMAEQRGASRVVSFDRPWRRWGGTDGYRFLHEHFESKCEFIEGDAYRLAKIFKPQEFDIVLCYGVLYHMSDPLLAIQNLFAVCKSQIAFEGLFTVREQPVLELKPYPLGGKGFDASVIYAPSVKFMDWIALYEGFSRTHMTDIAPRMSMIYERTGPVRFKIPDKVFPPTI